MLAFFEAHAPHLMKRAAESESYVDDGIWDSLLILAFLAYLEKSFGVAVPDEAVVPEKFGSPARINDLVQTLRHRAGP
jgi:acyl carrier protein